MPISPKHFIVSARYGDSARSETRGMAASAMVLADLWASRGCEGIVLTDKVGQRHTRDGFRALLCGGKTTRRVLA